MHPTKQTNTSVVHNHYSFISCFGGKKKKKSVEKTTEKVVKEHLELQKFLEKKHTTSEASWGTSDF